MSNEKKLEKFGVHNPETDGRYEDPNTTEVEMANGQVGVQENDGHSYIVDQDGQIVAPEE